MSILLLILPIGFSLKSSKNIQIRTNLVSLRRPLWRFAALLSRRLGNGLLEVSGPLCSARLKPYMGQIHEPSHSVIERTVADGTLFFSAPTAAIGRPPLLAMAIDLCGVGGSWAGGMGRRLMFCPAGFASVMGSAFTCIPFCEAFRQSENRRRTRESLYSLYSS